MSSLQNLRTYASFSGDPHRINLQGEVNDGKTEGNHNKITGFQEKTVGSSREGQKSNDMEGG